MAISTLKTNNIHFVAATRGTSTGITLPAEFSEIEICVIFGLNEKCKFSTRLSKASINRNFAGDANILLLGNKSHEVTVYVGESFAKLKEWMYNSTDASNSSILQVFAR